MSAAPTRLTTADRALLRAWSVWGRPDGRRFWSHFIPDWRSRLEAAGKDDAAGPSDRQGVRTALLADHAAEARVDPASVHPSWFVRALKDESPAVQRAVVAHAPPDVAEALRSALPLDSSNLAPDRPPQADALRWSLALWSERLVGGPPAGPDDPPAIAAIAQPDRHAVSRLLARLGLAKLAVLANAEGGEAALPELASRDRDRLASLQATQPESDPMLAEVARADWATARQMREHALLVLGLTSIARLLAVAEPFRVRWALQHLPYNLAKFARLQLVKPTGVDPAVLIAWESRLLSTAQKQVAAEAQAGGARKAAP